MKKTFIILGLFVAVLAAYWIAYGVNPVKKLIGSTGSPTDADKLADNLQSTETTKSPGGAFNIPAATAKDAYGFPLSIGSTGEYVRKMQQALNANYGSELVVDGIFGTKTAKALSAHGFNPDAIYWSHYYKILGIKI